MSLYALDKVMREVIQRADAHEAFSANAEAYLEGRDLSAGERSALVARDFQALYTLGAHPFLLVGFVATQSPPPQRAAATAAYQKSLADLGYPDYST
jgi:hypothetical protein